MKPILELRHLKSLKALEETGSISLASKKLFLTQSALSHQIKYLESYFGTNLFERKTNPIRFTQVGKKILQLADDILPLVDKVYKDITLILEGEVGEMRIAVECHTCYDWLIPAMDDFKEVWPHIELDIVSGFQTDPVGLLLSDRSDIAIVSYIEKQNNISYQPLFSYEMVAIMSKNHPLKNKKYLDPTDFSYETLITYPVADEMLDLVRKVLNPANIFPKKRHSELTIAIVQLVASGRGVAALPYWTVLPYLEKNYVVAKRITKGGLKSELYAGVRKEDERKEYLINFCEIVRQRSFLNLTGLSPIVE